MISRCQSGDGRAFAALMDLYRHKIFSLTQRVCAQAPAEADDVFQETFLTAFKEIQKFRGASRLGTWLYRIASNLCWTRLRRRRRAVSLGGEEGLPPDLARGLLSPPDDPAETARQREIQRAVGEALARLPVDYRMVVALSDLRGLKNETIAGALSLSLSAVKSRLHRGRNMLKKQLKLHRP
ncbi:MAG: sigma-70 family RNA polymerase sigma factor [Elusimicrobia bacterium]|nr:sigma-70 family RNA polymerase sigma factor [Elusimicrobiota bacterium]MBK9694276.1 sigma-70 family RNA polymerase sigma factor [Elusimicrobiota bacterium]